MAWNIYGDRLEPGHCEVHPWVAMEYPCPTCLAEADERASVSRVRMLEEQEMREQHYREERALWDRSFTVEAFARFADYCDGMEEQRARSQGTIQEGQRQGQGDCRVR